MNPRLKNSKKWTALPKEYSNQIEKVFKENFDQYLNNADLIVEGRIYTEEIVLRVGYLEKGRLRQSNFEISMNYSRKEQDTIERIHNCVDAAAAMMLEYFEKGEEAENDLPYTWKEFDFQGKKLYLQFTTENSRLEAEANRLLGLAEGDLLNEDEDDEDALTKAEVSEKLSPPKTDDDSEEDDDLDEEDKSPRMFSGKVPKKKLH